MIDDLGIENILSLINPDEIRVYHPTSVLFVCGGDADVKAAIPKSLRGAFMRFAFNGRFKKYDPILAEDLNGFFPKGNYRDLLTLENDIAQISRLVIIFSESFGSAAELGAFSMVPEISTKILVFIDNNNFDENSFIKLGPLRMIKDESNRYPVCVLAKDYIGIENIKKLEKLDFKKFEELTIESIKLRESEVPIHSTFDKKYSGHIIKLIVGLIQWYGALTIEELETALYCLDIKCNEKIIENYLLCAEFAKWVKPYPQGVRIFYAAITETAAVRFHPRPGMEMVSKVRWQAAVRSFWKENDPLRFASIQEAMREIA